MNRRQFLTRTAAASFTLSAFSVRGANAPARKYRTALIGCGWWGNNILGEAMASGECEIVSLCDVDKRFLEPTVQRVKKETSGNPQPFEDYRELLNQTKPEIVIIGTPDHWHPLQTIAAVKSGAHVYVEKPICHTIQEGRAMVNAARAAGRVVQVGTHRRISPHNVSGYEFIRSGKLGKVGMVRAFVHYGGGAETPKKNFEPPPNLNWDLWCGPAPLRPYNGNPDNPWSGGIHPRGFRNYLDYANGTLGDWGIHWLDQILWIMDVKWPKAVFSTGGRPIAGPPILTAEEQTTDAPDHQLATYQFDDFDVTWEHRRFAGNSVEKGENVGCYFYGEKGIFHLGWKDGWTFYPSGRGQSEINEPAQLNQPDGQNIKGLWLDLLKSIKTGKKPVCDIEEIHYSTTLSLLGMLSYKLGRSVQWDGANERCIDDAEASKMLRREYRKGWEYPAV